MKLQGTYVQVPDALMTETKLPVSALMVWIAMAHFANEQGECWAKVKNLATWSHCSQRTVHSALVALIKQGCVQYLHISDSKTVLYQLIEPHVCKICTHEAPHVVVEKPEATKSANPARSSMQNLQTKYAKSADDLYGKEPDGITPRKDTPPTPSKKPKAEPKYSITFDYDAGEFSMTEDARQKLDRDWPDVDVDAEIRKAEGWVLDHYAKTGDKLKNGLSFLGKWLAKPTCQRKAAGTMKITSGALAGKTVNLTYGGAPQENKRPTPPPTIDMSKIIRGA